MNENRYGQCGSRPAAPAAVADAGKQPSTIPADEMARLTTRSWARSKLSTIRNPLGHLRAGPIYKVDIDDDRVVKIDMTLTTPKLPVGRGTAGAGGERGRRRAGVREAKVTIVWDPPWDPSRMSDEARTELNMW